MKHWFLLLELNIARTGRFVGSLVFCIFSSLVPMVVLFVRSRIQKGRPMKRSKNVRKKKALEKAISKTEQSFEKVAKFENKKQRTQSAKQLYD
ncbi:unnamed protein product [Linum trigynum]|uniref:Uncharacterized protein n=1 Tax=Linum trigynum TaxID=586398 RepID=A0AAV2EHY2_9ROSI